MMNLPAARKASLRGRVAYAACLSLLAAGLWCSVVDAAEVAAGKLLVASRDLDDPNFSRTVVLVTRFDEEGAMGLVINRPAAVLPEQVLPEVPGLANYGGPLFLGGPVEVHNVLFLLRAGDAPEPARHVFGDVYLSGSRSLLKSLTQAPTGAVRLRIFAGYAGWAPGQLEHEIHRGGWHVITATEDVVFSDDPESIWEKVVPPLEPLTAGLVGAVLSPPRWN